MTLRLCGLRGDSEVYLALLLTSSCSFCGLLRSAPKLQPEHVSSRVVGLRIAAALDDKPARDGNAAAVRTGVGIALTLWSLGVVVLHSNLLLLVHFHPDGLDLVDSFV